MEHRIGGGGGGVAKDYARVRTSQTQNPKPLRPGFRKLSGFLMLSRAIWALFLSILIQNGIKNIVDQKFRGGGGLLHPPLNPPLLLIPPPPPRVMILGGGGGGGRGGHHLVQYTRWRRFAFAIKTHNSHRPQPEYTRDYSIVFNGLRSEDFLFHFYNSLFINFLLVSSFHGKWWRSAKI